MRKSIIRLMKRIRIWIKINLIGIGELFAIVIPTTVATFFGSNLALAIVIVASIFIGWVLIGLDSVFKNKKDLSSMPIPRKRFTSLSNGRIIIKIEELQEIEAYLYNLEEYLEKAGKFDEDEVKK